MAKQQRSEQEIMYEKAFTAEPGEAWSVFGILCIIVGLAWCVFSIGNSAGRGTSSALAVSLLSSVYLWPPLVVLFGAVLCGVGHLSAIHFYARQQKLRDLYYLRYGQPQIGGQD